MNNYLQGHSVAKTEYSYDAHGNMIKMPHLHAMHWDCNDMLKSVDLDITGNKAYYVYDYSGERLRKVVEKGNIKEERIYWVDYEIYSKLVNDSLVCERTTLCVNDDKAKVASLDKQTIKESSLINEPEAIVLNLMIMRILFIMRNIILLGLLLIEVGVLRLKFL